MVNDVLFGYFEDKTKSRWGKRRPYLIFCSIPFALAFWSVFSIPQGLGNVAYFFLIIGTFILFDTFHTLIATAYSSMTAEITSDYNERTSLSTYRMVFSIVGYLMGAGLTSTLASIVSSSFNVFLMFSAQLYIVQTYNITSIVPLFTVICNHLFQKIIFFIYNCI